MKFEKREESVIGELTSLFERRGYKRYKPGCFEEYSLYQENKDFLISKNVITFTGLGGKLLAMRPDVSLSVIKHTDAEEGTAEKLFYHEKVYRQPAEGGDFREISQTGAEIVGDVDEVCEAELCSLICETLACVSKSYLLDISHMGFTEGLLSEFKGYESVLYEYLKKKDLHDFDALAREAGFSERAKGAFKAAVSVGGKASLAIEEAEKIVLNDEMKTALDEMKRLVGRMERFGFGDKVSINFSIANDADYYNGLIFNGYIGGVPRPVLSGGRYDKLIKKLGKDGGAIGFALYLGEIERYFKTDEGYVDTLVIYDKNCQDKALDVQRLYNGMGSSVRLSRRELKSLRYGNVIDLRGEKDD